MAHNDFNPFSNTPQSQIIGAIQGQTVSDQQVISRTIKRQRESSGARKSRLAQEKFKLDQAEKARIKAEIKSQARAEAVRVEQERITDLRTGIKASGGSDTIKFTRDADSGDKIKTTTTKRGTRGGTRIFTKENLETGEKSVRTFETPKGGGRSIETGGVSTAPSFKSDALQSKSFNEVGMKVIGEGISKFKVANQKFSDKFIRPITQRIGLVSQSVGGPANLQQASVNIKSSSVKLEKLGFPKITTKTGEFISNIGIGASKEIINKPLTTGATFVVGGVVGGGVKAVGLGAKAIKFGTVARIGGQITKGVVVGGSVGLQTVQTIKQPSQKLRAESIGAGAVQTVAFGTGFKSGSKSVGFFGDKIKVVSPTRQLKQPTFIETTATVSKGADTKRISSFVIKQETRPPIKTDITTPFRKSVGAKPLSTSTKPARVTTIRTVKPSEIGKPFLVTIQKQGSKKPILATISGKSKQIELTDVGKLPRVGQFVSGNLGRATGTGNVLVQRSGEKITAFGIKQKELAKISTFGSKNNKGFNLEFNTGKLGRTTTRTAGLSKSKTFAENNLVRVTRSVISFKDVTKRFPRGTGKAQILRGTTFELKEPIILKGGSFGKRTIKSSTSRPQSQTLSPQVQSLPKPLVKASRTPTKTVTRVQSSFIPTSTKTFSAVSSRGLSISQETRPASKFSFSSQSAFSQAQFSKPQQQFSLISASAFNVKSSTNQKIGQASITKQATQQKQGLRQGLLTTQLQQQIGRVGGRATPFKFKGTKTKTEKALGFKLPKIKRKKKRGGGIFVVQVRRGGVFGTVGKSTDINQAVNLGVTNVSQTLGATFRIKGATGGVRTPQGFRLPKASSKIKGPLTFIEKRSFRLSKFGEQKEIKRAKAKRKGRKK